MDRCAAMDDSDLVLIHEPVRLNLALLLALLAVGYGLVCLAMLVRVYLRVGRSSSMAPSGRRARTPIFRRHRRHV